VSIAAILRTGPFVTRIETDISAITHGLRQLYAPDQLLMDVEFSDFDVAVVRPLLRRWYRPQATFLFDGHPPFLPLPLAHAVPLLEWGLNWAISLHAHEYLIVHAAVIERDGFAAIMPGVPGAGKSTPASALAHRGWRILSDELALISFEDRRVVPLERPINLKNESIEVIRRFAPDAAFSPIFRGTSKGDVALMRPSAGGVACRSQRAIPAWIIFPKYINGLPAELERKRKAQFLLTLASNAFNFSMHGRRGFELMADIVDQCDCFRLSYAELDEAVEIFAGLRPPERLASRQ